jgi:hypothetical protein
MCPYENRGLFKIWRADDEEISGGRLETLVRAQLHRNSKVWSDQSVWLGRSVDMIFASGSVLKAASSVMASAKSSLEMLSTNAAF